MKKLTFVLFMVCAFVANAQYKSSMETRALMQELQRTKSATVVAKKFDKQLAIRSEKGEMMVRAIAKVSADFDKKALQSQGVEVTSQVADIVALRLPLMKLSVLENRGDILQYTVAHQAAPLCDAARTDTHADSVQDGIGLPQEFKGDGVLVGVTDWGFDYGHPNFNSNAERRVLRAWDQYKTSGPAPAGFTYGTEYNGYDALKAAGSDTSNIYGYHSHGSHCAGIIGGRGTKKEGSSSSKYIGIAPHVNFLFGSWLLDEASWMDQAAWMSKVAKEENKRLIISNSWGMYSFSTLDGTSLLSQAINHWSDSGIVFVTSGGNNGYGEYHLQMQFQQDNDTMRSQAAYFSTDGGQMLIFWGMPGQDFQSGFAMGDRDGGLGEPIFFSTTNEGFYEGFVVYNDDTIHYSAMVEHANVFNQRPHILLKVDYSRNQLHLMCTAAAGTTVHAFNVNYYKAHESNTGCAFLASRPGYKAGDNYYGIGEPACAEKSIAVAAHASGRINNDGEWQPGGIAYFSSYGPTLDGRNKPEISAPGVNVISSYSSYDQGEYTPEAVATEGGRSYRWTKMSGTSMAGPQVAGICALMLQANPNLTVDQVKQIICTTALNDSETGSLHAHDSVDIRWGYGKINAYACVCAALDRLSIEDVEKLDLKLQVYPNPAKDMVTIMTYSNMPSTIEVFALDGKKVYETEAVNSAAINVSQWQNGVYIVRSYDRMGVRTAKMVVK